jgi:hypothetical protein
VNIPIWLLILLCLCTAGLVVLAVYVIHILMHFMDGF